MNSPAALVRQVLLYTELVSESSSWPCFVSFFPDDPNEASCIYDTAGKIDGRVMQTGEYIRHPGVMIQVRGRNYVDTWKKVEDICQSLSAPGPWSVRVEDDWIFIQNISRVGEPQSLGIETRGESRRHVFTINFLLTIIPQ